MGTLRVTPLAAESFGVRSMCTMVETPDVKVLLDAGVSLCPFRSGYPPHPLEFNAMVDLRKQIAEAAEKAEIVTISHYHFDHHTPSHEDWLVNWTEEDETAHQIYTGKRVLMKNPDLNINASQRERARKFQKTGGKYAKQLEAADGGVFSFGAETKLQFSKAVFHGSESSGLGWVTMVTVSYGDERFVFAPDVQGPMASITAELIKAQKPRLLLIGGPPFYLAGFKVDAVQLRNAVANLKSIVEAVPTTIIEHHTLRDSAWQTNLAGVSEAAAEAGHRIVTGAEYAGKANLLLEAKRARLYADHPPSKDFQNWMRLSGLEQSHTKPPI